MKVARYLCNCKVMFYDYCECKHLALTPLLGIVTRLQIESEVLYPAVSALFAIQTVTKIVCMLEMGLHERTHKMQ